MYLNLVKEQINDKPYQSNQCKIFNFKHYDCKKHKNQAGDLVEDKFLGWVSCTGGLSAGQRLCSEPNPKECYIGLDSTKIDPYRDITWSDKAPYISCQYNIDNINTIEQLYNIEKKFPISNNINSVNEIKKNFCYSFSKKCPIDPETNKPFEKCSRFISLDDEGEKCREWVVSQPIRVSDIHKKDFCHKNPNLKECQCLNRHLNDDYKNVKKYLHTEDYCWYLPCASGPYLKQENIQLNKKCSNICQIIIETNKNHNVKIDENQNIINCQDFKQKDKQKDKQKNKHERQKQLPYDFFFFV